MYFYCFYEFPIAESTQHGGRLYYCGPEPDHLSVWSGRPPLDFGTDLAKLTTAYGDISAKAALVDAADGGAADVKAAAESVLENAAFVLTRALASHFKKIGDLDRLAKVDFSKTEIVKLRAQLLLAQTTAIRDIAAVAVGEPDADKRGVTSTRVATLSAAITSFAAQVSAPRGQIVNRATLNKELETDMADLLEQVGDLDDLVLQFDGDDAGNRFIAAWKRAREVVDIGHGHASEKPAPTPAPPAPAT